MSREIHELTHGNEVTGMYGMRLAAGTIAEWVGDRSLVAAEMGARVLEGLALVAVLLAQAVVELVNRTRPRKPTEQDDETAVSGAPAGMVVPGVVVSVSDYRENGHGQEGDS